MRPPFPPILAAAAAPACAPRPVCPSTCSVGPTPPGSVHLVGHCLRPTPACTACSHLHPRRSPNDPDLHAAACCMPPISHPSSLKPPPSPRTLQQDAQLPVVPQQGGLHRLGAAGALLVQLLGVAGGCRGLGAGGWNKGQCMKRVVSGRCRHSTAPANAKPWLELPSRLAWAIAPTQRPPPLAAAAAPHGLPHPDPAAVAPPG